MTDSRKSYRMYPDKVAGLNVNFHRVGPSAEEPVGYELLSEGEYLGFYDCATNTLHVDMAAPQARGSIARLAQEAVDRQLSKKARLVFE